MLPTWILLISITGNGGSAATAAFYTEAACNAAATEMRTMLHYDRNFLTILTKCVPSGAPPDKDADKDPNKPGPAGHG